MAVLLHKTALVDFPIATTLYNHDILSTLNYFHDFFFFLTKGRLGLGHEEDACSPQEVTALNTEEVYIVNVCCSSAGTILLSDVGSLYACGENSENR